MLQERTLSEDMIILPKAVTALGGKVITTMYKYEYDLKEKGLITHKAGELKEIQQVLAVGNHETTIKEGDLVKINLKAYGHEVQARKGVQSHMENYEAKIVYNPPIEEIDGEVCLMLEAFSDIDYIIDSYHKIKEEQPSDLIVPETKIIKP